MTFRRESLYNEAKPGAAGRFFNLPPERRESQGRPPKEGQEGEREVALQGVHAAAPGGEVHREGVAEGVPARGEQGSRWGLESNLAPGFLLFGLYFFLRGMEDSRWLLPSALMYGLALYCYATLWPFVPLILLGQGAVVEQAEPLRAVPGQAVPLLPEEVQQSGGPGGDAGQGGPPFGPSSP